MRTDHPYRFGLAIVVVWGLAFSQPHAHAETSAMDPLLEATLQLKVQSYDRKLARRLTHNNFVVGIVYKPGVRAAEAAANEMRDAFTRVVDTYRIKGIKPAIVMIAFDKSKLVETLTSQQVAMIYVARGLDDGLPAILDASVQLKIPTVGGTREQVTSGCTIAIVVDRRKPKIIINIKSVGATGMELDAEVLELAEVVR